MCQLPAVTGDIIFAVHIVDYIGCVIFFQCTEHIAVTDITGCQGIIAVTDIGNQVVEYLFFVVGFD